MGAQRLHHRLRRRPRARRPLGRPGGPQEGLPHRAGHLHRRVGPVRRRPVARLPRRRPGPAGHRRRAHAADLARTPPARLRTRRARAPPSACGRPSAARPRPSARPIGGLLVQASWRWVFLVNLPFSRGRARAAASALLDEVRDPDAHKSDLARRRPAVRRGGQPGRRHRRGLGLGLDQWPHPRCLRAGRSSRAPGSSCARCATPTRSSSPPSSATAPWRWPTSARSSFFGGFGALVLGGVLFLTGVWHESVLRAGFMIAPGPLLAGLTAFPGGLLGARFGHRVVGTARLAVLRRRRRCGGSPTSAPTPDWAGAYLPGSLLERLRRRAHAPLARRRRHRAAAARSASPPAPRSTP